MTEFKRFLLRNGISNQSFADKAGSSVSTIQAVATGKRLPSLELAKIIHDMSYGNVSFMSWFSEPEIANAKNNQKKRNKNGQA
jgi:transcriptional regulator with XRE-family HTH domain